jgi:hypothetical protein
MFKKRCIGYIMKTLFNICRLSLLIDFHYNLFQQLELQNSMQNVCKARNCVLYNAKYFLTKTFIVLQTSTSKIRWLFSKRRLHGWKRIPLFASFHVFYTCSLQTFKWILVLACETVYFGRYVIRGKKWRAEGMG